MTEPTSQKLTNEENCPSFLLFNHSEDEAKCLWKKDHLGCHSTYINGEKFKWPKDLAHTAELKRLTASSFIENATDVSEQSRKLVEKNEQIARLEAEVATTRKQLEYYADDDWDFFDQEIIKMVRKNGKKVIEFLANPSPAITDLLKAKGEVERLRSALQVFADFHDAQLGDMYFIEKHGKRLSKRESLSEIAKEALRCPDKKD